jgi:hypothetical protein
MSDSSKPGGRCPPHKLTQASTFLASIAGLGDSGQVDISERDEDILKREIDPIHGWTTKPDRL